MFTDQLDVRGSFRLGAGSNGIDPVPEEGTVTIVGAENSVVFTQFIPPGALKQKGQKGQEFEFKGKGKGKEQFEFHIAGEKPEFASCT